ncbi:helix-turn-helix domain-containing protein [Streptoalloteichus hindustanus]|nr:helix-turn-helix transcriptional regulator [Streptoalloteichus hindustanus]
MTTGEAPEIGTAIRRMRRWRGMTLDALAGLSGLSKGYLSRIENGRQAVERRSTLAKIANALRCSVGDLTGTFVPTDQGDSDVHGAIPDIQFALVTTNLDHARSAPQRPTAELKAETARVADARQACDYTEVGRALPSLLVDLHATAVQGTGDDRNEALRCLILTCQVTTLLVRNLGENLLAWNAAQRGLQAAERLGDPVWAGVAEFAYTQALVSLGAYDEAHEHAQRALRELGPDDDKSIQVYGTSLLTAGFCAVTAESGQADDEIAEARNLARRVERPNAFWLGFSDANVDLWRMSIALESEDPVLAAEVAARLAPEAIPLRSRRATFFIDHARALAGLRRPDREVVELLRRAEQLAPLRTRNNVFVRSMVTEMIERSRRDSGGRELLGLAERMSLVRPA